ncbi:uncharacterized protein [Watersipora subatra]|uniref:uncharacterized protein n=1 Tax=Watersipora subatra TaxID=2589382 RepID=UPI00355C8235
MRKDGVTEKLKSTHLVIRDGETSDTKIAVIPKVHEKKVARGIPKSGRVWKRVKSQRFSKIRLDKPDSTSWKAKIDEKHDKAALKSLTQSVREEKLEREKAEREQTAERRKRKLENEKKNEVVVPIKNAAKIKRMRKKQLRSIVKKEFSSLTHIRGRMRREITKKDLYSQQSNLHREAATWLPKGFVELPRFEIPVDVRKLAVITPIQFLSKYCTVTSRVKRLLYHKQYARYREPKVDGIDSLEKLKKALKDICTYSLTTKSLSLSQNALNYYLHDILQLKVNDSVKINFKTFIGIAALAERIFHPGYMEAWWKHDPDLQADFKTFIELQEEGKLLQEKQKEREMERGRQQSVKETELAVRLAKRQSVSLSSYKDVMPARKVSLVELAPSPSEEHICKQVEAKKHRLERKLSITDILDLKSKPQKYSRELLEMVDFHAINWKFKDVKLSPSMQRIVNIILML